ncbi:MAG: hypothetical protein PSV13_09015 [Lacunisphaera sp.]|nr:hypothetical protein [Lacunisphaera sp.]
MFKKYISLAILALAGGGFLTGGQAAPQAKATPPNIVIIFNDDMGYRDLGCFGSPRPLPAVTAGKSSSPKPSLP